MRQFRTAFNFSFSALILGLLLTSCSYGQSRPPLTNLDLKINNQPAAPTATAISLLLKKQILLTNAAQFTNRRSLEGASGFLIKYGGANFAVTARHLLGEAGGVEPEIRITDLNKSLLKWEMMPRVVGDANRETIRLSSAGLNFSQSSADIVLLKVTSTNFDIFTLTPNFELPVMGETLYLIGCPYSESGCRQNAYPVKFVEFDQSRKSLVCEMTFNVDLSGFSGAPLVNTQGAVFGALVSGGAAGGKNYVMATPIREIQKIKF